jgi:hypothetical protein
MAVTALAGYWPLEAGFCSCWPLEAGRWLLAALLDIHSPSLTQEPITKQPPTPNKCSNICPNKTCDILGYPQPRLIRRSPPIL